MPPQGPFFTGFRVDPSKESNNPDRLAIGQNFPTNVSGTTPELALLILQPVALMICFIQ